MGIPEYPRGWFTVHFGLSKYVAEEVAAKVTAAFTSPDDPEAARPNWFIDGDGWNSWGEPPSTESNDKHTRHVQIVTPFLAVAMSIRTKLEAEYYDDLVPIETGDASYLQSLISGSEDWASGDDVRALLAQHDWNLRDSNNHPPRSGAVEPVNYEVHLDVTAYLTGRPATDARDVAIADFVMRVSAALKVLDEPLTVGVESHRVLSNDELPDWIE